MSHVLVVEDEKHLAEGLRFNLEADGYQVTVVETGEAALDLLRPRASEFDILVLDVMLPGVNGFTVLSRLRAGGQTIPTLVLTARGRAEDILEGFAAGADDYVSKPFDLAILMARIRSLVRRRDWMNGRTPSADSYAFDGKSVRFDLLELHTPREVFPLTTMEANVLRYLINHEGKPVSRKAMLEEIWGVREDTDTRPIDNFIVRLRRYIEEDPTRPRHLLTVRGVGYRFVASPAATSPSEQKR